MKYAMKKVRKNGLSGATAIVTPLIFLMSLATRRISGGRYFFDAFKRNKNFSFILQKHSDS